MAASRCWTPRPLIEICASRRCLRTCRRGRPRGLTCMEGRSGRVMARDVVWVGIDAGKEAHHAAAIDGEGRSLWSMRVLNDQAAIEALIARAGQAGVEVRWAVDLTCAAATLLLALLVAAGQPVVYVPGRTVNRMTGAFAGEGKTDAKDARVIADTARLRRDLTELCTPDELVVELSRLVAHRADLMADWVRGVNRLRELLTAIFPALERAFDYSTPSALILVAGYQTPQAIRDAGSDVLAAYLTGSGAWRKGIPAMVNKAVAACRRADRTAARPVHHRRADPPAGPAAA